MALPIPLSTIFQCIDQKQDEFLKRFREAISVSTNAEKSQDTAGIIEWVDELLKSLGFFTELKNVEVVKLDGAISLTSVIFGSSAAGHCPNKSTILIYCHFGFTGIQKEDELRNDLLKNNYFFGNGILDLSSIIAWLNTIEAFETAKIDNPVNIKIIMAPKETESSPGLNNLLIYEKDCFLEKVDYVCINEGSWLQADSPCLVKKLKGVCYFSIEVECSMRNMESTKCSGIIRDAMKDLIYLLEELIDDEGNLRMSELDLQAEKLSEEEISVYINTDLDLNNFMKGVGANSLLFSNNKSDIFQHRFLFPTLTIHDINSSLDNINEWNIPARATAKLSIRTFHKSVNEIFKNVNNFLQECWSRRKCNNKLSISLDKIYETWNADVDNVHFGVAAKSIQYVYQKPILFLNNDNTIPIVNMLQTIVGKNILLLPITSEECYMNEMVPIGNYLNASKMFASYLYEMGGIPNITSKSSTSFTSCQSVPEMCVCGKLEGGIQAASGDSEDSRPDSQKTKNISDEDNNCVCPYRPQVQTKDAAVLSDNLTEKIPSPIPKPCKCTSKFYGPADLEKISLISTVSTASRNPNPVPNNKEEMKKNITPSADTIKCACVPNRFRDLVRKEENIISSQQEELLMKSMRSAESEISGFSSCKYPSDKFLTPKMKILGCVCPEKSQESVYDIEIQKNRLFCPVIKDPIEMCNKGGKRRHHIIGPASIDEEENEIISVGPLSHCSCSEDSIIVVPTCDCSINYPVQNKNDEVD